MVREIGIILITRPADPFSRGGRKLIRGQCGRKFVVLEVLNDLVRRTDGETNRSQRWAKWLSVRLREEWNDKARVRLLGSEWCGDETVTANVEVGKVPHLRIVVGYTLILL
jgi:hypothetical protein